jgi:hypothetical protein
MTLASRHPMGALSEFLIHPSPPPPHPPHIHIHDPLLRPPCAIPSYISTFYHFCDSTVVLQNPLIPLEPHPNPSDSSDLFVPTPILANPLLSLPFLSPVNHSYFLQPHFYPPPTPSYFLKSHLIPSNLFLSSLPTSYPLVPSLILSNSFLFLRLPLIHPHPLSSSLTHSIHSHSILTFPLSLLYPPTHSNCH